MSKSKFTLPKCPYCKEEYKYGMNEYALMHLGTQGWCKQETVVCHKCNKRFNVSVHISYYGSKMKKGGLDG
jgi:uncharacterized protein YbaR (Trm112 family)